MGNNQAYWSWEHTIIELKRRNLLTLDLLDAISSQYSGMDVDHGGSEGLTVNGLDADQIAVLTVNPNFKPDPDDEYDDSWHDEFYNISRNRWGWH